MKKFTLALMAHEARKKDLVSLIKSHPEILRNLTLISPAEEAGLIMNETGMSVEPVMERVKGGSLQIGAMAAQGEINGVVFLRDAVNTNPDEPDWFALLRVCDQYDIPLATNLASAEAVLHLISEHPEALAGHHLAAGFLEEMAAIHES